MISQLLIKNFAIIKELEVEFYPGLSVITGETGAGKSIVIEAMSMALAGRADRTMVRNEAEKATISIITDGVEMPEVLVREINKSGKSLCKADGEIVTLAQLENSTTGHVDVHGQYDHQSLLAPEKHILLLDAFGGPEVAKATLQNAEAYELYKKVKAQIAEIVRNASISERESDFLRYEIKEIDDAKLVIGEDKELEAKARIMQNSEKIYEALTNAYSIVSGEGEEVGSALSAVGSARDSLAGLSEFNDNFAKMAELSNEAYFTLEELESQVRHARDSIEFSQSELDNVLARLDRVERLKAKYGGSIEDVLGHREEACSRIENVEDSEVLKVELEKKLETAKVELKAKAQALSSLRKNAANRLEISITEQLKDLSFKDAVFSVSIETDENEIDETGFDSVEFMLSANKGQPLYPLAKVASGGELSRIMLALKSVTGDFDGVETMIFDEIDSGISGYTASIVGEKLLNMAKTHQIICITHLPQIAAFADHHYMLQKYTDGEETFTTLKELDSEARVDEIARLVGGRDITEKAKENARELIKQARR